MLLHYRNAQILNIRLGERKLRKLGVCSSQGLRSGAIYLDSWQALELFHVPAGRRRMRRRETVQVLGGQTLHPRAGMR